MSDGKVQLVGGKVLVSAAGKVATADECCCGCQGGICDDCGVDQPDAIVSIGDCEPPGDPNCHDVAGVYTFLSYADYGGDPRSCRWRWKRLGMLDPYGQPYVYYLELWWYDEIKTEELIEERRWAVSIYTPYWLEWYSYHDIDCKVVKCESDGHLQGLIQWIHSGAYCTDCPITITFGD